MDGAQRWQQSLRERNVAAIGWGQLATHAEPSIKRQKLVEIYQPLEPQTKQGTIIAGASQVWRFVKEIQDGDGVITYSPVSRLYLMGSISGPMEFHTEWAEQNMPLARPMQWQSQELVRDSLGTGTKNSLCSTLTMLEVLPSAKDEIPAALKGELTLVVEESSEESVVDPLADIELHIKGLVSELDWDEIQQLVAG
ncbi:hypothetical protein QO259_18950 [Salinicola sp. JS01]|uniref:restriction endonuclease n=1 Tax=Salinicola sp. JS01 TaxID=3050071 RepID=UPI00255B634E|nr:hypothetical protein [Salinicola sp. JS01]WIX32854.1 hypothetical protein QO259_18950 [Salinicola sp. JS01]